MGPEIDIESILALDKQIEEGTGDIIQLKRARNSLLNISTRIHPEILGDIFCWNVIPVDDFGGLEKRSYNFVLVCHHWFKVASNTPELWSFWGNTLNQWSKRYQHRGTVPIDVRLDRDNGVYRGYDVLVDKPLRDALRDRAERDSIRSLHLSSKNTDLLRSIHSLLIPGGQGIQRSSIESLILEDFGMDLSGFFTRRQFPKLRRLNLLARQDISAHLASGAGSALTTMSLVFGFPSSAPAGISVPQLLSIFASTPRLQQLSLSLPLISQKHSEVSAPPIQLCHMKRLRLVGKVEPILQLLHQIDHPEPIEERRFFFDCCGVADVSEILGPYLRDCIQRDGRFRDGLGIGVETSSRYISVQVATAIGVTAPTTSPKHRPPFLVFEVSLAMNTGSEPFDKLWVDFIAHTPREHVICLQVGTSLKEIIPTMPNIQELGLVNITCSEGFLRQAPDGPSASTKLLPSLRYLQLYGTDHLDWPSLVSYLVHQTSGGQVISLRIVEDAVHICLHVVESIQNVVEELVLDLSLEEECPLDICWEN